MSSSNSAFERGFSILTMMPSDRLLKTSHALMSYRIIIKCNDKFWSNREREEILKRALSIYLEKRPRKRKIDTTAAANVEVELSDSDTDSNQENDGFTSESLSD